MYLTKGVKKFTSMTFLIFGTLSNHLYATPNEEIVQLLSNITNEVRSKAFTDLEYNEQEKTVPIRQVFKNDILSFKQHHATSFRKTASYCISQLRKMHVKAYYLVTEYKDNTLRQSTIFEDKEKNCYVYDFSVGDTPIIKINDYIKLKTEKEPNIKNIYYVKSNPIKCNLSFFELKKNTSEIEKEITNLFKKIIATDNHHQSDHNQFPIQYDIFNKILDLKYKKPFVYIYTQKK